MMCVCTITALIHEGLEYYSIACRKSVYSSYISNIINGFIRLLQNTGCRLIKQSGKVTYNSVIFSYGNDINTGRDSSIS